MSSIGLDVGTTGCKATVISADGKVVAFAYQAYDLVIPGDGMWELDPSIVWQSVKRVLKQVAIECASQIEAIAVASFGESFVSMDDAGNILGNSILYSDIRGTDEINDILDIIGAKELFNITGMPINAMYSLNKLLWIKKHTNIYEKSKYIMLCGDFIGYMLTGKRAIDYSLASRTLMFDYRKKTWSTDLMQAFDIDKEKFSYPVPSGEIIGELSKAIADEIGLSHKVLLVAGAHDQVCAALGAGVLNAGDCVDGIGTSECITTILSDNIDVDFMLKNNFCIEPYVIEGKYVTLAFTPAAGASVNWYKNTIEKTRNEEYKKTDKSIYKAMEEECPKEPSKVLMVPYLAGTGTPYMDSGVCGAFLGLKVSTTRGELYKACLEGICFDIMHNAELIGAMGTKIKALTCVGGVTQSDMLMQIKADIMGLSVSRLKVKESGTMGLAMLCFIALKKYASFKQAAEVLVKKENMFLPQNKTHDLYLKNYEKYKKAYIGLKQIMG